MEINEAFKSQQSTLTLPAKEETEGGKTAIDASELVANEIKDLKAKFDKAESDRRAMQSTLDKVLAEKSALEKSIASAEKNASESKTNEEFKLTEDDYVDNPINYMTKLMEHQIIKAMSSQQPRQGAPILQTEEMDSLMARTALQVKEDIFREQHGDYDETLKKYFEFSSANPALAKKVMDSPNPPAAAYRETKALIEYQGMSPEEVRKKILAEMETEMRENNGNGTALQALSKMRSSNGNNNKGKAGGPVSMLEESVLHKTFAHASSPRNK